MCGRYTYYSSAEILERYELNVDKNRQTKLAIDVADNYNVSPGNEMPVIIRGGQFHQLEFMIWGLVPAWSKTPDTSLKLINARKEGLLEKPMWKRLVKSKRCIAPARGFYEWKKEGGIKQPYYITPKKGTVFSFAGLWDEWNDAQGNELMTYTIITTTPNAEMKKIHSRMPAILTKQEMDIWLEPQSLNQDQIDQILAPPPDGSLDIIRVSTKVNNARHNGKDLIYPLNE